MSKNKLKLFILCFISTVLLVALDQYTKFLAVEKLKNSKPFVVIDGIFEFLYVENRGVAWGAFSGKVPVFIILTCIIIPLILFFIYRIERIIEHFGEKVNIKALKFLQVDLFFLVAGAIGNLIDRVANGFVVDFLYFKLIDFPVFNVADCYVTVSALVLLFISFFFLKDEEIEYLTTSKKNWQV